jgi:hypothetical protein
VARFRLALFVLAACDDPSFSVHLHRADAGDAVRVRGCEGCTELDPYVAAPTALDRTIGFFVRTAPQTLMMQWRDGARCDEFGVSYSGNPFSFDVAVSSNTPATVSGCASCTAVMPCTSASGGGAAGGGTGGGGTGGSGGTGGNPATIQWEPSSLPTSIRSVIAVQAFSSSELWIAADTTDGGAVLYLDDGGSWVSALATVNTPSFTDLGIIESPARIAVAEPSFVHECDRSSKSCRSASDWQAVPTDDPQSFVNRLCTDGARFYATGSAQGDGALFTSKAGFYQRLIQFTGGPLEGCTVTANGSVFSAGTLGELYWYSPQGGSGETRVQAPGFTPFDTSWIAAHTASGRSFFAGNDRTIVELLPDAGFSVGMPPTAPAPLRAIAGLTPEALIAAGDDFPPNGAVQCNGTTWAPEPSLRPHFDVYAMVALDAHTYLAGGQLRSDDGGVAGGMLLRGTR